MSFVTESVNTTRLICKAVKPVHRSPAAREGLPHVFLSLVASADEHDNQPNRHIDVASCDNGLLVESCISDSGLVNPAEYPDTVFGCYRRCGRRMLSQAAAWA